MVSLFFETLNSGRLCRPLSGVELEIDVSAVDMIPEAAELAKMGILPEGMYRNRAFAEDSVDPGAAELWHWARRPGCCGPR